LAGDKLLQSEKITIMIIVGLSGTNGAGKDAVADILKKDFGFGFVNVSDFLRQEAGKRKLEPSRENLRIISAQWRRDMGVGVLVDMAMDYLKDQAYPGVVISPMRNSGEAQHLKELGGKIVWVDAEPRLRFSRIANRGRDKESTYSFEEFVASEQAEMNRSGDEATLNMADVKAMADITIDNSGSFEELKRSVAQKLGLG
jgi:dephospho-CoA kinase